MSYYYRFTLISKIIRIIVANFRRPSKILRKKTFLKIIIFIINNKKSTINLSSLYNILFLFNRSITIFFARISLSKESLIYIFSLSNSIFIKSIIIFFLFFL